MRITQSKTNSKWARSSVERYFGHKSHLHPLTSPPRRPQCQVKNVLVAGVKIPRETKFVPTARR